MIHLICMQQVDLISFINYSWDLEESYKLANEKSIIIEIPDDYDKSKIDTLNIDKEYFNLIKNYKINLVLEKDIDIFKYYNIFKHIKGSFHIKINKIKFLNLFDYIKADQYQDFVFFLYKTQLINQIFITEGISDKIKFTNNKKANNVILNMALSKSEKEYKNNWKTITKDKVKRFFYIRNNLDKIINFYNLPVDKQYEFFKKYNEYKENLDILKEILIDYHDLLDEILVKIERFYSKLDNETFLDKKQIESIFIKVINE